MSILNIDAAMLKRMIIAGANHLEKNKQIVDELNVFPVPDGDTGTNMSLTVLAAAREVEKSNSKDIYEIAKAAASGSLRGEEVIQVLFYLSYLEVFLKDYKITKSSIPMHWLMHLKLGLKLLIRQ